MVIFNLPTIISLSIFMIKEHKNVIVKLLRE
jgi:hypothetical protein